jgi:hypothetical protein
MSKSDFAHLYLLEYSCSFLLHFGAGRGRRAESEKRKAKEQLDIAAKMIEEMRYGRRRPEVEELRKQLAA